MIFTTQKDELNFLSYMYEDSNIRLERKYQKYLEIKNNS